MTQLQRFFLVPWQREWISVEQRRVETQQAFCYRLAHSAHTDHSQTSASQPRPVKPRTPSSKLACSDEAVAVEHPSSQANQKPHGEFCRGNREQIRHNGEPDAPPGAAFNIEIVIAFERGCDNLQIRTGSEEIIV